MLNRISNGSAKYGWIFLAAFRCGSGFRQSHWEQYPNKGLDNVSGFMTKADRQGLYVQMFTGKWWACWQKRIVSIDLEWCPRCVRTVEKTWWNGSFEGVLAEGLCRVVKEIKKINKRVENYRGEWNEGNILMPLTRLRVRQRWARWCAEGEWNIKMTPTTPFI